MSQDNIQKTKAKLVIKVILERLSELSIPSVIQQTIRDKIIQLQSYSSKTMLMYKQIRQAFLIQLSITYNKIKSIPIREIILTEIKKIKNRIDIETTNDIITIQYIKLKCLNHILLYQLSLDFNIPKIINFIQLVNLIQQNNAWNIFLDQCDYIAIYTIMGFIIQQLQKNNINKVYNQLNTLKQKIIQKQQQMLSGKYSARILCIIAHFNNCIKLLRTKFIKNNQKRTSLQKMVQYYIENYQNQDKFNTIQQLYQHLFEKQEVQIIRIGIIENLKQLMKQFLQTDIPNTIYDFSNPIFVSNRNQSIQRKPNSNKSTSTVKSQKTIKVNIINKLYRPQFSIKKKQPLKKLTLEVKKPLQNNQEQSITKQIYSKKYNNKFYIDMVLCKRQQQIKRYKQQPREKSIKSISSQSFRVSQTSQIQKLNPHIRKLSMFNQKIIRNSINIKKNKEDRVLKLQFIKNYAQKKQLGENINSKINSNHRANKFQIYFKTYLTCKLYSQKLKQKWKLYDFFKLVKVNSILYFKKCFLINQLQINWPLIKIMFKKYDQYILLNFNLEIIKETQQVFKQLQQKIEQKLYMIQNLGGIISPYTILFYYNNNQLKYHKNIALKYAKQQKYFQVITPYMHRFKKYRIKTLQHVRQNYFQRLNYEGNLDLRQDTILNIDGDQFIIKQKYKSIQKNITSKNQDKKFYQYFQTKSINRIQCQKLIIRFKKQYIQFQLNRVKSIQDNNNFIIIKSIKSQRNIQIKQLIKLQQSQISKFNKITSQCYDYTHLKKKIRKLKIDKNRNWSQTIMHSGLFTFPTIKIINKINYGFSKGFYILRIILFLKCNRAVLVIQKQSKNYYCIVYISQIMKITKADKIRNSIKNSITKKHSIQGLDKIIKYQQHQKDLLNIQKNIQKNVKNSATIILKANQQQFILSNLKIKLSPLKYFWNDNFLNKKTLCLKTQKNITLLSKNGALMHTKTFKICSKMNKKQAYQKLKSQINKYNKQFKFYSVLVQSIVIVNLQQDKLTIKLIIQKFKQNKIQIQMKQLALFINTTLNLSKKELTHSFLRRRFVNLINKVIYNKLQNQDRLKIFSMF